MGMLGRLLATVVLVLALGACGSRTPLRITGDGPFGDPAQAGAAGPSSGAGGSSGDGAGGAGGRGDSGAGGRGGDNSAGDGGAGMSAGSSSGGRGGTGSGGDGSGGMGTGGVAGFSIGQSGVGGMIGTAGVGGFAGMAGEILNPHGCDTPHPFVLSIDPAGSSGTVRGWLESAAGLVFEDQLPRFARSFGPGTPISDRSIALWWSIGLVEDDDGQGSLYFYAGDFTGTSTEVAVVHGASGLADVDVDALDFRLDVVEARTGSILAFRNPSTGQVVGLRVDQIIQADPAFEGICAAVGASWLFLR